MIPPVFPLIRNAKLEFCQVRICLRKHTTQQAWEFIAVVSSGDQYAEMIFSISQQGDEVKIWERKYFFSYQVVGFIESWIAVGFHEGWVLSVEVFCVLHWLCSFTYVVQRYWTNLRKRNSLYAALFGALSSLFFRGVTPGTCRVEMDLRYSQNGDTLSVCWCRLWYFATVAKHIHQEANCTVWVPLGCFRVHVISFLAIFISAAINVALISVVFIHLSNLSTKIFDKLLGMFVDQSILSQFLDNCWNF